MKSEGRKLTGVMKRINRAMNQLPNAAQTKRGLVFISYSSTDEATVVRLDTTLAEAGMTPWWARHLQGGERFGKAIIEAIDAACAAVVVWSAASVQSAWVLAEATRAFEQGKLVPVRFADLHPMDIPPPFTTLHTLLLEDQAGLIQAIERQIDTRSRGVGGVPARVALNNSLAPPVQG
jgi:hypothetical protein